MILRLHFKVTRIWSLFNFVLQSYKTESDLIVKFNKETSHKESVNSQNSNTQIQHDIETPNNLKQLNQLENQQQNTAPQDKNSKQKRIIPMSSYSSSDEESTNGTLKKTVKSTNNANSITSKKERDDDDDDDDDFYDDERNCYETQYS